MALKKNNVLEERILLNEALIYYYLKDYKKVVEILENQQKDAKLIALEGIVINKLNDVALSLKFISKLKSLDFYCKGNVYCNIIEYMREKFEQYSYAKLLSFLKSIALPQIKENCVFWIYEQENLEYFSLCFELGKYKEAVRHVIKTEEFKNSKNI